MSSFFSTIKLGDSVVQVVSTLGQPLLTTTSQNYQLLWYSTTVPRRANIVYLLNEQAVLFSEGIDDANIPLSTYIVENGQPVKSILVYPDDTEDPYLTTIHIWPEKGISVVSEGFFLESRIIRVQQYSPSTLDQYLSNFGQSFSQNSEVVITQRNENVKQLSQEKTRPSFGAISSSLSVLFPQWQLYASLSILAVILLFVPLFWKTRK